MRGFRERLFAMLGLCFVLVMVALDQTVIGTALPTVVAELNGFGLYAWVGTAYLLTSVITVPIFGKLGDEHGRKPFVLAAILLFTAASMLCGISMSMLQLVFSRALQGIGGGMLVIASFASVPDLFPDPKERLRWQVLFSTAFGLANAVGPSLGGYLTQYFGWRSVFFVNLPVGMLSLFFVWKYLPRIRHSEQPPSPLDWAGAGLIALTLTSLQLFVEWLPENRPGSWLAATAFVGLTSLFMLLWWESKCENPVLPLAMFRRRELAPLFSLSLMMGFCMFSVMYYAPLMLQGGFGLPPDRAGLLVTPLAVSITVGSIINGRIVTRISVPNRMLFAGLALFGTATFGLAHLEPQTAHPLIAATMMTAGLGIGMLMPNLTLFVQGNAHRSQLGVATAMLQSTRMIGGMLGTAIVGTLVSHRYASEMLAIRNWGKRLSDPQILVNHRLASKFAFEAGNNAAGLMNRARFSMVSAIHHGFWLVAAVLFLAFWVTILLPPIHLGNRHERS